MHYTQKHNIKNFNHGSDGRIFNQAVNYGPANYTGPVNYSGPANYAGIARNTNFIGKQPGLLQQGFKYNASDFPPLPPTSQEQNSPSTSDILLALKSIQQEISILKKHAFCEENNQTVDPRVNFQNQENSKNFINPNGIYGQ